MRTPTEHIIMTPKEWVINLKQHINTNYKGCSQDIKQTTMARMIYQLRKQLAREQIHEIQAGIRLYYQGKYAYTDWYKFNNIARFGE